MDAYCANISINFYYLSDQTPVNQGKCVSVLIVVYTCRLNFTTSEQTKPHLTVKEIWTGLDSIRMREQSAAVIRWLALQR